MDILENAVWYHRLHFILHTTWIHKFLLHKRFFKNYLISSSPFDRYKNISCCFSECPWMKELLRTFWELLGMLWKLAKSFLNLFWEHYWSFLFFRSFSSFSELFQDFFSSSEAIIKKSLASMPTNVCWGSKNPPKVQFLIFRA